MKNLCLIKFLLYDIIIIVVNDMKKNKYLITVFLLAVIGVAFIYQQSYARYVKNVDGDLAATMASWNIKVNNESVLGKTSLENQIDAYFPGNEYVREGVIAPGASGYFDLIIDPTDVDVAFSYTIDLTGQADIPDIKVVGYEVNPTATPNMIAYDPSTGITNNIPIGSTTSTVRVYVKWDDSAAAEMDNSTDTVTNQTYTTVTFDVYINFTQINN